MAIQSAAQQFFSGDSLAALSGSSAFVWIIVNGIRKFLSFYRKWVILVVSLLVVVAFHSASNLELDLGQILLGIGNTFLLAFTAAGAQETLVHAAEPAAAAQQGQAQYHWFQSWFG